MRIRKRHLSLPLSSFPPLPLSDPRPIRPSPMVQLPHASSSQSSVPIPLPPPLQQQPPPPTASLSHLPPMEDAGDSSHTVAHTGAHDHHIDPDRSEDTGGGRDGDGDGGGAGGEKRNDTGKAPIFASATLSEATPLSPSHLDGKWCDGEKAIPPKKRRGRAGDYIMSTNTTNTNNSKKMKTKMNKKCTQNEDDGNEEEEEEERKEEVNTTASKKRGRGGVVMEGSRCSRVNGRGWRCCQQTLVGYSLCEHHLGKGRLRSIASVRSRSIPSTAKNNDSDLYLDHDDNRASSSISSPQKKSKYDSSSGIHDDDVEEHKEEKKPAAITKKRMKLGMVKARSISSLLGQTNTLVTLHEDNK